MSTRNAQNFFNYNNLAGRMRQVRRWLAAGITLAVLGPAIAGCHKPGGSATGGAGGAGTPAIPVKAIATQVSVKPARIGSISETAVVTGQLTALHDVTVGVKIAGKLVEVDVREGDMVRVGTVVARQDTTDLEQQRAQQMANVESARTKKQQAQAAYNQSLAVLRSARTNVQLTREQTNSGVRQAQAILDSAVAQADVVKRGARLQERQQAEENVRSAKADRDKARADLKRYQDLYRQQAIAAQQLDQAQSVSDSAEARYNSSLQASSLIREGSRPEDIRRAEAAVEQARQGLITAQANRDQVNLRQADLQSAQAAVQNAQAGIASAQAGIDLALAALRLSEQAVRDATIVSPINGVVAERKAEPGQQIAVAKGDVARIVALDSIYFDAQLPETGYAEVRAGQGVAVTVDALPGRTFQGTVTKIFPVAAAAARSFTVRISLRNEGSTLRPGMFARGIITLGTHSNVVLVPRDALLDIAGTKARLFVARNGAAEERQVQLGMTTTSDAEIVSGLRAGERVVTTGQAQIQNGDKIQVQGGSGGSGADNAAVTQNTP